MFIHYLRIALRNLIKNPLNSLIKTLGLALGLAGVFLVMIVNYSELTWDSFWVDADKIYFLRGKNGAGNREGFQDSISEIDYIQFRASLNDRLWLTEMRFNSAVVSWSDDAAIQTHNTQLLTVQVAADFIAIFQPNVIAGDLEAFATDPNTAFITRKAAQQLFGDQNPIGKQVMIPPRKTFAQQIDNQELSPIYAKIIAVVDMDNARSQIPGGLYHPKLDYPLLKKLEYFEQWEIYVKPKEDLDAASITSLLNQVVDNNLSQATEELGLRDTEYQLMPISDRHLHDNRSSGNQQRIMVLGMLGLLILIVALSNFINLSLAGYVARQKEVALLRIHGASKPQLFWQYWLDSAVYVGIACLAALIVCELVLPQLKIDLQIPLVDGILVDPLLALCVALLLLVVSWLIALYPAIYFSKQSASTILRANRSAENKFSIFARKILLILQFIAASGLIIGLASIYMQLKLIDNYQPGYKTKDIVMLVDRSGLSVDASKMDVIQHQLKSLPGVIAASNVIAVIPGQQETTEDVTVKMHDKVFTVKTNADWYVSPDFFSAMGIPIIAGNRETIAAGFELTPEGAALPTQVVLCRSTVLQLGFKTPQEALGQPVEIFKWIGKDQGIVSNVRAVIEDVHLGDHKLKPKPCMYMQLGGVSGALVYAINFSHATNEQEVEQIKKIWESVTGAKPHHWLFSGSLADQYRQERNIEWFLMLFALVALVIGILGVYGMTALSTQKRAREIALRKLHGANVWQIIGLINRDITLLVIIANLIAWPIAGYLVHRWLENFYQHFSISIWLPQFFVLALIIGLASVWFIASAHSLAQKNLRPVDALRNAD